MIDTSARYQMDEADDAICIITPYRKQWHQILSLIIGISASGCILFPVIIILFTSGMAKALNKENPVALILPFAILLLLLIFSYIEILWQLTGREIITITDEYIHIRHQIHGFGVTNKVSAAVVSEICLSRQNDLLQSFWTRRSSAFWSYQRGRISIHSARSFLGETQIYRFGSILNDEESARIVESILKRFPNYHKKSTERI